MGLAGNIARLGRGVRMVASGEISLADAVRVGLGRQAPDKVILNLEITSRCNTSCSCCMRDPEVLGIATNINMTLDQVREILDYYETVDLGSILLGGSESLLHPQFFEIVELIGERFPLKHVELYTNGILFSRNRELLERVTALGLGAVTFSLQAATQDKICTLQPGISIEGTLAAARYMRDNSDATLWASYVVQESNLDEVTDFVEMIAGSAFHGISLIPMNRVDFTTDQVDYMDEWAHTGITAALRAGQKRAAELGVRVTPTIDLCSCGMNMDVVRANGVVQLCPGNARAENLIGNVFEEGFDVVRARKNDALHAVVGRLHGDDIPAICRACAIRTYDKL